MSSFSSVSLPWLKIQQQLIRRKCFISYYHGDRIWARYFVDQFGGTNGTIIPRILGLEDDAIQSSKPDYVIDTIRAEYISGSSVSIVLIGPCTHSRRFVDWEIKRGLLNGNGLLGIILPPKIREYLPGRFAANWRQDDTGYAALRASQPHGFSFNNGLTRFCGEALCARRELTTHKDVWGYHRQCSTCRSYSLKTFPQSARFENSKVRRTPRRLGVKIGGFLPVNEASALNSRNLS